MMNNCHFSRLTSGFVCVALFLAGCGGAEKGPTKLSGKTLDDWRQQLRSTVTKTRFEAVRSLGKIGAIEEAIPALVAESLKDKEASVRLEALVALEKMKEAAKPFLSQIKSLQNDVDAKVKQKAVEVAKVVEG
jgi:HEAT repeat protein